MTLPHQPPADKPDLNIVPKPRPAPWDGGEDLLRITTSELTNPHADIRFATALQAVIGHCVEELGQTEHLLKELGPRDQLNASERLHRMNTLGRRTLARQIIRLIRTELKGDPDDDV